MKAILKQFDKNGQYRPNDDKLLNAPFRGEVSTMWLGEEHPGMNVALYIPGYHAPLVVGDYNPCMTCFQPGGRIEIEALPEEEAASAE